MNQTERRAVALKPRTHGDNVPARALPAYQQIKRYVVKRIADGDWKPGSAIPTEAELVKEFGVARMTVSRALRELTAERVLTRIQGAGTFVEPRRYESTVLEIRNIADEIAERGHRHTSRVLSLDRSDDEHAIDALALDAGPVFHSRIVHYEEGEPIQFEDRYVNPKVFPAYLDQDFTIETPNHYMVRLAPIQRAEFRIYAQKPDAKVRRYLMMEIGEPCLMLWRRTWVGDDIATSVQLWHPASRFHLAGNV
ncbi:histidine utilization repressor [Burkholderia oklahomensis]|uniref:Histidine utilization repressor n=1 Tax=Burkholderia oklahomensis TaxID=342113 RepID=A0AAI8BAD4_9BURK|nr:histidine utilization repressor [Burkholderia oklahomensis]AIO68593.1 histidine utilization repressor [Burkholderia oklahomensis]AJX34049.1 histidine utilization repressor [Burkholderia oklahomensis C6786]AOI38272.1 histidine utilization repressor [Burkholderia oklahomensis EO147]AOI47994.1 histidine utilization repressor [Burkholderia oklahomensis C6786]KUY48605.1 histidine utilization repressor [Burkholderia oklahomensis EO147]